MNLGPIILVLLSACSAATQSQPEAKPLMVSHVEFVGRNAKLERAALKMGWSVKTQNGLTILQPTEKSTFNQFAELLAASQNVPKGQ